ncbi:filaggrin-2-like [Prinia subflava]|uniref:filaggrin-2-like n=1 Tax=Prinia subflava TaxID=208062 RepID=UPI002FE18C2A
MRAHPASRAAGGQSRHRGCVRRVPGQTRAGSSAERDASIPDHFAQPARGQRSGLSLAGRPRTPRLSGSAEPPAGQPAGSFPSLSRRPRAPAAPGFLPARGEAGGCREEGEEGTGGRSRRGQQGAGSSLSGCPLGKDKRHCPPASPLPPETTLSPSSRWESSSLSFFFTLESQNDQNDGKHPGKSRHKERNEREKRVLLRHHYYGEPAGTAGHAGQLAHQNSNSRPSPLTTYESLCQKPLEDSMRKRIICMVPYILGGCLFNQSAFGKAHGYHSLSSLGGWCFRKQATQNKLGGRALFCQY